MTNKRSMFCFLILFAASHLPAVSHGQPVGVTECDEYAALYLRCVRDRIPEASQGALLRGLNTMLEAWRAAAKTEADRAGLANACRIAQDTVKKSFAAFGCDWSKPAASKPAAPARAMPQAPTISVLPVEHLHGNKPYWSRPLAFSRDGKVFYFVVKYDHTFVVFKSEEPFTSAKPHIEASGDYRPWYPAAISADGSHAALFLSRENELALLDLAGGKTMGRKKIGGVRDLAFSRTSAKVYIAAGNNVHTMSFQSGSPGGVELFRRHDQEVRGIAVHPYHGSHMEAPEAVMTGLKDGLVMLDDGSGMRILTRVNLEGSELVDVYPMPGGEKGAFRFYVSKCQHDSQLCFQNQDGNTSCRRRLTCRDSDPKATFHPAGTMMSAHEFGIMAPGDPNTTYFNLPGAPKFDFPATEWSASGDRMAYLHEKGMAVAIFQKVAPPFLAIKAKLREPMTAPNGALEPCELAALDITVQNKGKGDTGTLTLKASATPAILEHIPKVQAIHGIAGKDTHKLLARVAVPADFKGGDVKINMHVSDPRGFDANPLTVTIPGKVSPLPALTPPEKISLVDKPRPIPPENLRFVQGLGAFVIKQSTRKKIIAEADHRSEAQAVFHKCLQTPSPSSALAGKLVLRGKVPRGKRKVKLKVVQTTGEEELRQLGNPSPERVKPFLACAKAKQTELYSMLRQANILPAKGRQVEFTLELFAGQRPPETHGVPRIVGNGNGKLEAGEVVELKIPVKNNSLGPSFHPQAKVTLDSSVCPSKVFLIQDLRRGQTCSAHMPMKQVAGAADGSPLPTLGPQGTTDYTTTLLVHEAAQLKGIKARVELWEVRSREGCIAPVKRDYPIKIEPKYPDIVFTSKVFDGNRPGDSQGNSDGEINPGEIIELALTLKNKGQLDISSVSVKISTETEGIVFVSKEARVGRLPMSGEEQAASFVFTVQRKVPVASLILSLDITPRGFPTKTHQLQLAVK